MKALCKVAALPFAALGTAARGAAGKVLSSNFVKGELKTRALQKVPILGGFVPPTRTQQVQQVGSVANSVRSGGVSSINAARSAAVPPPQPPQPPQQQIPKQAMLNAYRTYDDMEELGKDAGFVGAFTKALPGYAAGAALSGVTLGLAHGGRKLYQNYESDKVWRRLQKENPELTRSREGKENFEVLKRFSPKISGNVTTARSYLQRAQQTGMVPHEFVKDLTQIQSTSDQGGVVSDFAKSGPGSAALASNYSKLQADKKRDRRQNKAGKKP